MAIETVCLRGLPGTSADKEADVVRSVSAAVKALRAGRAATASGDNGAINVWRDDTGKYRCESMRYRVTQESQTFTTLEGVASWVKEWLVKIQ